MIDLNIGDEIIVKDATTDDEHTYSVEAVGRSFGLATSVILTIERQVDTFTIERRNMVYDADVLIEVPDGTTFVDPPQHPVYEPPVMTQLPSDDKTAK